MGGRFAGAPVEQPRVGAEPVGGQANRVARAGAVHEAEVLVEALPDRLVRDLEGVVEEGADGHGRAPAQASFTGFSSVPRPVISSFTLSPGWSVTCGLREKPTPAGV